jgi:transposase
MKNKLKEAVFESFISKLGVLDSEMSEVKKRRIADALTIDCLDLYIENNAKMTELYQEKLLEYEQNRKTYGDDILFIQDNTNKLLDKMKEDGFVSYKYDEKTKQKKLVSRTSVVNDMVIFLNVLNHRVVDYYVKTFKADEKDYKIQTTLF